MRWSWTSRSIAGRAAVDYLGLRGWSDATVTAEPHGVTVVAGQTVPLGLMRLFGHGSVRVTAVGYAVPYHGIGDGRGP